MHQGPHIEVIRRNLRWEVAIDGITQPLVDWFFSRERAIAHAVENGRVMGSPLICIKHGDGTVDTWLTLDGTRLSQVA